jgi:hypothetical protein
VAPGILLADTSSWPGSARLAIGLLNAGCNVSAVCPIPDHPLLNVHAVRKAFPYSSLRPLDSLLAAIDSTQPQIIIPGDDTAVQHLHELYTHARRLGAPGKKVVTLIDRSLGAPESYPIVSSRYDLLKLAREEGIRVPDTKLIRTLHDLKTWHAEETRPSVLKADGTWGGNGVRIAYTLRQAEQFFSELSRRPSVLEVIKRLLMNRDRFWLRHWWGRTTAAIIAQELIRGRPANCAVLCWEGRVLSGIGVEVVSERWLNGPATVVRVVNNSQMLLSAERIARRLRLSGFFGLDFMIEDQTDTTYLIEMNPRCTQLCHLHLGKDRDMIGALSAQLSGQTLRETPPVTQNEMIAYFPEAWICKSEFLESSFHDIPLGEPDLIEALLRPSSDRAPLGRVVDYLRRLRTSGKASEPLYLRDGRGSAKILQSRSEG